MNFTIFLRIARFLQASIEVAQRAMDALNSGDIERVNEILPEQLATTTAKRAADAAALAKFGNDGPPTGSRAVPEPGALESEPPDA